MFNVGDEVTWVSQANGHTLEKRGKIAQVVPAGERPSPEKFPHLYKSPGCGGKRGHDSYVVLVGTRPFWPLANKLRHATLERKTVSQGKSSDYCNGWNDAVAKIEKLIEAAEHYVRAEYHDPDRESSTSYFDRRRQERRQLVDAIVDARGTATAIGLLPPKSE